MIRRLSAPDVRLPSVVLVVVLALIASSCGDTAESSGAGAQADEVEPVSVLLIGDSIMNQAGVYIEEALESDERIDDVVVHNEGVNGTGLLTPNLYDWHDIAPELIEEIDPDIIAILFVGNYTLDDLYVNRGGAPIEGYTNAFWDAWEYEARRLQTDLAGTGADIFWVNPPPMAGVGEQRVQEFRQIHRGIAENWTGTVLVDGTSALSTEEGEYAFELPNEEGVLEQVRTLDSVHLTQAGAKVLATEIARQLVSSVAIAQRDAD